MPTSDRSPVRHTAVVITGAAALAVAAIVATVGIARAGEGYSIRYIYAASDRDYENGSSKASKKLEKEQKKARQEYDKEHRQEEHKYDDKATGIDRANERRPEHATENYERAREGKDGDGDRTREETTKKSWWQRIFGGGDDLEDKGSSDQGKGKGKGSGDARDTRTGQ